MSVPRGAARDPWLVLALAIIAAAVIVLTVLKLFPLAAGAALSGTVPAIQETILSALLYGLLALVGWLGRRAAAIPHLATPIGPAVVVGLAIGIGGLVLALGESTLAGAPTPGAPRDSGSGLLLLGTLVVLGQSAGEELYFRGWLQPVLAARWGLWPGVIVTALAFAALHVAGGARGGLALVNLALGGVLFGLLAARVGGLAAAIAAHFGWNWAEGILFGLDPNPGVGSFGAIRNLDLAGSGWWGGSAEGLNGSLAMAVVLTALLLPAAVRIGLASGPQKP